MSERAVVGVGLLLAAALAAPDDPLPRLALADQWEAVGHPDAGRLRRSGRWLVTRAGLRWRHGHELWEFVDAGGGWALVGGLTCGECGIAPGVTGASLAWERGEWYCLWCRITTRVAG